MTSDWIKMRCNLWTHPKVVKLMSRLSVTRVTVIGALHAAWTVADQHASDDGVLEMDAAALDGFAETPGFCQALQDVGWLEISDGSVKFPRYHEHNGSTAKSRASAQKRQKRSRKSVTPVTQERDQRRGEKKRNKTPTVPLEKKNGTPFTPPSLAEVTAYCSERKSPIDPEAFMDYFTTSGWKLSNGNMVKDWQSAIRNWERKRNDQHANGPATAGDDYVN
jgi:hypothetical protein